MTNYDNLIYKLLKGETPKEKYEWLDKVNKLIINVGFTTLGEPEKDIYELAENVRKLITQFDAVNYTTEEGWAVEEKK